MCQAQIKLKVEICLKFVEVEILAEFVDIMYTPVFGKVEIEVEDQLSNLDIQIKSNFTFLVGWGEWVVGDFERKAISASNSVEVEVESELGNNCSSACVSVFHRWHHPVFSILWS